MTRQLMTVLRLALLCAVIQSVSGQVRPTQTSAQSGDDEERFGSAILHKRDYFGGSMLKGLVRATGSQASGHGLYS